MLLPLKAQVQSSLSLLNPTSAIEWLKLPYKNVIQGSVSQLAQFGWAKGKHCAKGGPLES